MVRPPQDAIETFISITGASEAVALQKIEDHGGDLNEAINAHFSEGDRNNTHAASTPAIHNDFMNLDDPIDLESSGPTLPLLSAARSLNPFAVLDSNFGRRFFDGGGSAGFSRGAPQVSHPREVREIPIEIKDGNTQPGSSGLGPTIEDVTGSVPAHGPEIHGTVIIDEDDEDLPSAPDHVAEGSGDVSYGRRPGPTVIPLVDLTDYSNDIEEEMIRAAIEASKRESEGYPNRKFVAPDSSTSHQLDQKAPALGDVELARAVTLSLKTAEQEKALREQGVLIGGQSSNSSRTQLEEVGNVTAANERQGVIPLKTETSSQLKLEKENPYVQEEAEDVEEQPLVRHRSRRIASGNAESPQMVDSPPSSPQRHGVRSRPQVNGDTFQTDEWGIISSEEHDDAVMLEAAIFGGIPEGTAYRFGYPRIPQPPSPTLTAQRLLKEQQDDEYLAALQADREKELKAKQEAEAALQKEKHQEEEIRRKLLDEEEFERKLAAKKASLLQEPSSDDESAVTLLVRMPDGSRYERRFLKSDKLQLLFDYIDVGRVVKPGTYRLVRPYPRRAFTDGEGESSLSELGLTSKQEALFLELIQ